LFNAEVYAIEDDGQGGYRIYAGNGKKTSLLTSKTVVLAVGASERALAFPGWTLPGVITAGAAQTMVNVYHVACGRRVLIVGAGNVGLIVAYQLLQAGIKVEAVIEASSRIGGYEVHAAKIRRAGIPVLTSHTIVEARGIDGVEEALISRVDKDFIPVPGTERILNVDTICLAVGLLPLTELAETAGCEITSPEGRMEFVTRHDEKMRTSRPGIFVAGDAAGVDEASIAIEEGAIAGLYAAGYLGLLDEESISQKAKIRRAVIQDIRSPGVRHEAVFDYSAYENRRTLKAVLECFQEIPCNPCEKNCPIGAIKVGKQLSALPAVAVDACIGCGKCVAVCPGQACFMVNPGYSKDESEICIPYEYLPLPQAGCEVQALDRDGNAVCGARVLKAASQAAYDKTHVLHILVPRSFAFEVRGIAPAAGESS
jgi:thioredoxin reductase/Fe-S-cluster-containing hydrogenase component 2